MKPTPERIDDRHCGESDVVVLLTGLLIGAAIVAAFWVGLSL